MTRRWPGNHGGHRHRRALPVRTLRKKHPVVITAGYIIGFPNDTRESILRDIDTMKRELPIDLVYFTNLTPLPGCEDHQRRDDRERSPAGPDIQAQANTHE